MCNTRHTWARFTRFLSDSLYLSDPLKVVRLKQADTWFTSDYVDAPRATVWPFLSLAVIVPTIVDSPKGSEAIKRILFSPIKGRMFKQSDSGSLQQELMMHSDYPSLWKHPICNCVEGHRITVVPSYKPPPLVYCVCRSFFVMLARCSLCILTLFYTRKQLTRYSIPRVWTTYST